MSASGYERDDSRDVANRAMVVMQLVKDELRRCVGATTFQSQTLSDAIASVDEAIMNVIAYSEARDNKN